MTIQREMDENSIISNDIESKIGRRCEEERLSISFPQFEKHKDADVK